MLLLVLGLLATCLVSTEAQACSNSDYTRYSNGRCYRVVYVPQHYDQAESYCQLDKADVATVHSQRDNDVILQIASNISSSVWIGLVCKNLSSCYWSDGSATGDYFNFKGGTPDLNLGNCVYLATDAAYKGQWVSIGCSSSFFSFVCQLAEGSPVGGCPSGYSADNGNCYFVSTASATETDAEIACQRDGGHLASIHSSAENNFLVQLALARGYNSSIYIGLQFQGTNLVWTDGSPYDFNTFQSPFPSSRFGNCTDLILTPSTQGQWMNAVCSPLTLPYACKTTSAANGTASPTQFPSTCPSAPYYEDFGSVYSPGYPNNYPNNFDCTYILSAPLGDFVHIEFPFFQTASSSDYLQVFDGFPPTASLLGTLSGSQNGRAFNTTQTNTMALTFHTDSSGTAQGYIGNFWSIGPVPIGGSTTTASAVTGYTPPPTNSNTCPPVNYQGVGMIASPGYPNSDYGLNLNCTYVIRSTLVQVYLVFGEFDTETCCDVVTIYDGPSTAYNVIGRVSGHHGPGEKWFQSSQNYLTVSFTSDSIVVDRGWSATYSSVGNGTSPNTTSTTAFPSGGCPSDWVRDPASNRCFRLYTLGGSQTQNIQSCVQAGGQIASIHSPNTNNFLINYVSTMLGDNNYYVSIGLVYTAGVWGWADASSFDYNDWLGGEPNSAHGSCGAFKSFGSTGWLVVDCNTALGYICERS